MSQSTTLNPCFLCKAAAQVQDFGPSLLVDCFHCGSYEIESLATTMEVRDPAGLADYLDQQHKLGKVRPFLYHELFTA